MVIAVMLASLGILFITLLVVDANDNAYLYLWLAGAGLLATSLPFLISAAIPGQRAHRLVLAVARGLFFVVAALALLLLGFSVVLVPSQGYETSGVFVAHVIGLFLVATAAIVIVRGPRLIARLGF